MNLGSVGVWSGSLRQGEPKAMQEAAAELEELGYGTIWFPGREHAGLAGHIRGLLQATRNAVVATGIVNIWTHPAEDIAAEHHDISHTYPGRFLLGLGIAHRPAVEAAGLKYEKPLDRMRRYLDELDSAPHPVSVDDRILASLGPASLKIARDRSIGTHPYFMPVEHTRIARQAVGPGKIVAPELMVVLETNSVRARTIARATAERYLRLPNYTNNLLRLGYSQDELERGGSDRLIDEVIAWGDESAIMDRVRQHHAAGADHVCIQALTEALQDLSKSMEVWRRLAPVLAR